MSQVTRKNYKLPLRVSLTMLPSVVSSSLIFLLLLTNTFNVVDAVASSSSSSSSASSFYTSNAEGKNFTTFAKAVGCFGGVTCTLFYLPLFTLYLLLLQWSFSLTSQFLFLLPCNLLQLSPIRIRADTNWCDTRSFHTQHGIERERKRESKRERERKPAINSWFQFLRLHASSWSWRVTSDMKRSILSTFPFGVSVSLLSPLVTCDLSNRKWTLK